MELCYEGALAMPSSYAVMSNEEMTYTDGGIGIPNWLVGGAINLAIDVLVVGGAKAAASFFAGQVKKYGAAATGLIFSNQLKNQLIAKGVASGVAAGICGVAAAGVTILSWALDPGGQLASYIDGRDSNPNNGYCDF